MKKVFTLLIVLFTLCSVVFGTDYNVVLYSPTAPSASGIATSSQQYLGDGSWYNDQTASKFELYLPLTDLGSFTIDQIASLSFATKKVLPVGTNVDFYWSIYTDGTTHGWYDERLTSEPMYYNNYNAPYDAWTTHQTASGPNQMTFFDSNHSPAGYSNSPTLADLQAGPIDWSYSPPYWNFGTFYDYGAATVKYIAISTGSASNSAMLSYLDAIVITLSNGKVLTVNLEDQNPTPSTYIGTPEVVTCSTYDLDITVTDFDNVGSISLVLNYNPALLTYTGYTPNPLINISTGAAYVPGRFILSYAGPGVDIADNGVLFTLHFTLANVCSGTGGNTSMTWGTNPGDCEYAAPGGDPVWVSSFFDITFDIAGDGTDPVITCPGSVTINCDDLQDPANTGGFATATDFCDATPAISFTDAIVPGTCADNYMINRTWKAIDDCGNDATCVQVITVQDITPPELVSITNDCSTLDASNINACFATADAFDATSLFASVKSLYKDNCDTDLEVGYIGKTVVASSNCGWEITYEYSITDNCTNNVHCYITRSGKDVTPPALTGTIPAGDMNVFACLSGIPAGPTEAEIAAQFTDLCGGAIIVTKSTEILGTDCEWTAKYTYEVKDECDNVYSPSPVINYAGSGVPTLPSDGGSTVECLSSISVPTPPSVTFCGNAVTPVMTETNVLPGFACEGIRTYTFTYTFCAGVTRTWNYVYTVEHSTPLSLPANGGTTIACADDAIPPIQAIDIQQQDIDEFYIELNNSCGQSFTVQNGGKLVKVDFHVFYLASTQTNLTLKVFQGNGILGTMVYNGSGYMVSSTGWQTLDIPDVLAPVLSAGQQYTWWLEGFTYNSLWASLGYVAPGGPYAGGQAWDYPFLANYPDHDMAFRTFIEPVIVDICGNVIPTPTPVVSYSPDPLTCEGTITYTYTYTDCGGITADWVYTYTVDHTIPPTQVGGPVPIASSVECLADAVAPTLPVVVDQCGNTLTAPAPTHDGTYDGCEGTYTYIYNYTDCSGLPFLWTYTYTIDILTAPVVPAPPSPVTVECEAAATPPAPPTGIVDVCGNAITPYGPVPGGTFTSLYGTDFSTPVVTAPTAAPGVWYSDRYNPAGFISPVSFGGNDRLKHSISAADGANSRPPAYSSSFYNTQGRAYDLMDNTGYSEIKLFVPANWATTNKRMAGFWGVAADAGNAVSGYPIVEFTSDGTNPRFRAYEPGTGVWVDMGVVSFFDVWYDLSIELLPSGEFMIKAGSLSYTTTTGAPYASVRLKSVILQGHNYDPVNPDQGVNYDIYWDDFTYQICEGTKTYTWNYEDCSGLSTPYVVTYIIDHTTPPAQVGGPVPVASTVSCPAEAVPPVLPVVADFCGTMLPAPAPVVSAVPECEGQVTYTYTYVDCAGLNYVWTYTYTIDYSGGLTPPDNTIATVSCPADATDPGAPAAIQDACGRTVNAAFVAKEETPATVTCNGTIIWRYRYTACDGTTTADWTKTYTVTYSGGLTAPGSLTATVSCPADATDPGAPAAILDACGRTVNAAFVAKEETPATVTCNGTIIWRYRYTACDNSTTADWTKTYTVTYSGGLTAPGSLTATVSCPADATDPGAPANISDACGRTVIAQFVAKEETPYPVSCNGTIIWRYRYTACDGSTTADWTKTYTVTYSGGLTAPVAGASSVPCLVNATDPGAPANINDACGRSVSAVLVGYVDTPTSLTCEGTRVWTYRYTACDGTTTADWTYTYTIDHTTAPVVPSSPAPVPVECEASAIPPAPPSGIVDQCGAPVIPTGPVVGGTYASLYNTDFSTPVVTGPTADPGVWYTDRYNPAGFVSPVSFGGNDRLMHSISAADGANSRPGSYSSAFYNTQGRGYDLMANSNYVEIDLFIPADWANTGRRMAGLWGVATDAANAVSGYPILEFTSDGGAPRFRAWESGGAGGWFDIGAVTTFDVWVKLSIELLPSGEFLCKAGSLSYTTNTSAPDASIRLKSIILQGHNTTEGVAYDIYWDNFGYQICEGTKTYTWTYTDCAGLASSYVYTYIIDHITPPAQVGGPVSIASTVSCPVEVVAPLQLPVVADICGTLLPAPAPVVSTIPGCEGDVTYTYTYPDCSGLNYVWTYTYTIDYSGGLTAPTAGSSSVPCLVEAVDPGAPADIIDACGRTVSAFLVGFVDTPTALTCEGTRVWTYRYTACDGTTTVDWTYTYTIDHTIAPVIPSSPAPVPVECEASATPPAPPSGIVDQCGAPVIPTGPVPGGTYASLYNTGFSASVVTSPTAAPGVWYTDRYAPAGFISPVSFGGNDRLMHSIAAADGANNRPLAYSSSFYNTQGRAYDLMDNTNYMEIDLYIPADWETTGRRMAGFWGVAVDAANAVSAYPIIEFTSDGGIPRFRAWESAEPGGWMDMGAVTTFDTWVKLSLELLPSGEFLCKAGMLSYTTVSNAPGATLRMKSAILQGHNTSDGVAYDIYWDNFAYQICEGTKTYTWTYTDCAGLASSYVYTYTIDHVTPPAQVGGPVSIASTVSCPSEIVAPALLPVVADICGTLLPAPAPVVSTIPGCEGDVTYTYTYPDCSGLNYVWTYTYTIDYSGGLTAPLSTTATVSCPADATDPGAPVPILDACGRTVNAAFVAKEETPATVTCNGTIIWRYRYTACDNTTTADWTKTYTVTYSGGLTAPGSQIATVSCPADATDPGAPASITDACGRTVDAVFVAKEETPDPVSCNGTIVWRYRYTACDGATTADWTKTYTVTYNGGLTAPADGELTVSCPAAAVDPGAPANITDGCGRTVIPVLVGSTVPPGCEGTVIWTYRYTACDEVTTVDWRFFYTIDYTGGLNAPANEVATVSCPAMAVDPGTPDPILDACGRTVTADLVGSTTPPDCEGQVIWTYRYTACDGTTTADWTFTYTIDYSGGLTAPNAGGLTVSCPVAAVDPGVPADITDACGRTVSAVLVGSTTPPECEGQVVWTYRYTACDGTTTADWTFTYTIDYSGGLIAPANEGSTVDCPADAVNPGAPDPILDACGRSVNAILVGSTTPPACEGTVVWTYRYTACDGTTTADWTYTYTVIKGNLTGKLMYYNTPKTPMNNVTLSLTDGFNTYTDVTDEITGNYSFPNLCPGTYTLTITNINKPVGYINSSDAAGVNSWFANQVPIEHVKWMAGEVNWSWGVSSTDAKAIQNYFVYPGNPVYAFLRGPWTFWKANELVTNNSTTYPEINYDEFTVVICGNAIVDIYGLGVGDFNGSHTPNSAKGAGASLELIYNESKQAGASSSVELPVTMVNTEIVGAISIILNFPSDMMTVTDVTMGENNGQLDWSSNGNELRIGWHTLQPLYFSANDNLLTINMMTSETFSKGDVIRLSMPADPLCELADGNFNTIPGAILAIEGIEFSTYGIDDPSAGSGLALECRPNPFMTYTTLSYNLTEEGHITLQITDMLGRKVAVLADEFQLAGKYSFKLDALPLQTGVYTATLILHNSSGDLIRTLKLVRNQ